MEIIIGAVTVLLFALAFDWMPAFITSIVCTLGLSLIIWIPIFWIVGILVMLLIGLLYSIFAPQTHNSRQPATTPVTDYNRELVSFIYKSRRHGASDAQIVSRLQQQQWTALEIERAFQQNAPQSGG